MKITAVKAICLQYEYECFIADGNSACFRRGAVLIQIDTDTELFGIGECANFGASMTAMKDIVENQLQSLLIGRDPLEIEKLWETMFWSNYANGRKGAVLGAIGGIDIALWDLLGKAANMPLYKLLGANNDRVKAYSSAGFYSENKTLDDLKREMEGYLDRGYTAFKMKLGRSLNMLKTPHRYINKGDFILSMEEDLERVRLVRETIGKDKTLMVDMNCTWDADMVMKSESFFRENDIYWIEEPIRSDDIRGLARINKGLRSTMVAGVESEQGLSRYREMLDMDAMDVVQTNISWCGGITEARRIAALSLAYNKLFSPHTFFSAVLTAANVHFSASLPNVPFIESEENANPFRTELLAEPLGVDAEMNYIVPDKPGLGIELNWDVINRYRIG